MLNQPFFQIALPIMVTFVATVWAATWIQTKRLDDIVKRLEAIEIRLLGIENRLTSLEKKVEALEIRVWR